MLHFKTVTPLLKSCLETIMIADVFSAFRLVGGTSLSLQTGHRMSDAIDLFTDSEYGSVNFSKIDVYLKSTFAYVDYLNIDLGGMGKSYYIGNGDRDAVKLDVYYTDPFIRNELTEAGVRLAHTDDVIAMKIDAVQRGGRKKDFWDLHGLSDKYPLSSMLALHQERYPYTHDRDIILNNLVDFAQADNDFDPICLRGKYWEIVKLELVEHLTTFNDNLN